jgi:hypothetical protein
MPKRNCASMLTLFWPEFTVLGLSPTASRDHLEFTHDITQVLSHADFVQENAPEQQLLFPSMPLWVPYAIFPGTGLRRVLNAGD